MKIEWARKLSSRKFWALVAALVTAILVLFAVPSGSIEQVTAIIGAFGTIVAYIMGEAKVDAAAAANSQPDP